MIEIFKTNVQEVVQSKLLIDQLLEHFPGSKINFDLDDCDRILRIDGSCFATGEVVEVLTSNGYECIILD